MAPSSLILNLVSSPTEKSHWMCTRRRLLVELGVSAGAARGADLRDGLAVVLEVAAVHGEEARGRALGAGPLDARGRGAGRGEREGDEDGEHGWYAWYGCCCLRLGQTGLWYGRNGDGYQTQMRDWVSTRNTEHGASLIYLMSDACGVQGSASSLGAGALADPPGAERWRADLEIRSTSQLSCEPAPTAWKLGSTA